MTAPGPVAPDRTLGGHYAGAVTRGAAYAADVGISLGVYTIAAAAAIAMWNLISQRDLTDPGSDSWVWMVGLGCWLLVYFWYCWGVAGKTPGCALLGLRVVARDGSDAGFRRAFVRTITLPLSFVCFGAGFFLVLFDRERRALHDRLAGTAVVYDWDARAARLRFLARRSRIGQDHGLPPVDPA